MEPDKSWRAKLRARDTLARKDDLHAMVDQLNFKGREALRLWFLERQRMDTLDDEATEAVQKARRELEGLLPWLTPLEIQHIIKIVRALATK